MLSVNQNMRFDQSMRVLKQLLDRGELGEPVIATIEMRAIPHWQEFLRGYDRLTLLNMSIHHLDVLRFLFGDPTEIFTAARTDPRTNFAHSDGIAASTLQFPSGLIAVSLEDVWSGPREEGFEVRHLHQVARRGHGGRGPGHDRLAGLPGRQPLDAALRLEARRPAAPGSSRRWDTMWFPHAFKGVMAQLQDALHEGEEPMLSGADNIKTMALVEAGYRSMQEGRSVKLAELGY